MTGSKLPPKPRRRREREKAMTATLFKNAQVWDAISDAPYLGEVLVDGNRIKTVARGRDQIEGTRAASTIDCQGLFLMPGLVEGHCHLSFVNPSRNQDLGEIPPEEHLLRTMRNATLLLNHGFTSAYSAASAKLRIDVVVRQEIEDGYLAGRSSPDYRCRSRSGQTRAASLYRSGPTNPHRRATPK